MAELITNKVYLCKDGYKRLLIDIKEKYLIYGIQVDLRANVYKVLSPTEKEYCLNDFLNGVIIDEFYEIDKGLENKLKEKNILIEPFHKGTTLKKKWKEVFAKSLNKSVKDSMCINKYLWHIFSFKKVKHLSGQKAVETFNRIDKNECYIFYQEGNKALKITNASNIEAKDFYGEEDVYIVDTNMSWTYVYTHEEECGPYFYNINS